MVQALWFGLGVGAAVQAWRQWPPDGPVTADGVAVVFVVGLVCAYLAGRTRRGASATATATATATADASASAQSLQVVQVVVPDGRSVSDRIDSAPAMPWWDSPYAGRHSELHEADYVQDSGSVLDVQEEVQQN